MMIQAILATLLHIGAPSSVAPDVASAIVKYAKSPAEIAFLESWGTHETHFSERLIAGQCYRWECDHGRARGAFQQHRGSAGADWEELPGNIDAQVRAASRAVRWAMRQCPKDPIRGGFRVLGGLGCDRPLKGEEKRVATYRRALKELGS